MTAPAEASSYREVMIFLSIAGVVVPLFTRLRISPVLGFIGAGALFGPFGLGRLAGDAPWLRWFTITNRDEVSHLAEFGVVFLLFTIGLELSWERLRTLRRLVFGLGAAQVVASSVLLTGIGMVLGLPITAAIISGTALSLSSTAIVVPILAGQRRLNSPTGRTSFSVLLFQDLAVAPILFTLTALSAKGHGGDLVVDFGLSLVQAALALAVIVVAGRVAMRPLFHLVAQTRSPELFMAASFLIVIGAALIASSSGLSMALGAFVAGLLLAETEYRRAIEAVVDPFKGLLLGVFFVSVGMALDATVLARAPLVLLATASGLVLVKTALVVVLGRVFRLPFRVGLEAGLLLGAGGEFAFVLVGAANAIGILPGDVAQAVFVITTVTMIALPLLARIGRKLGRRIAASAASALPDLSPPPDGADRVIIAGYGRVGQLVAEMLDRHGVAWIALDANPAVVTAARGAGRPVYFGDTTASSMLESSGLATARALVVTLDAPSAVQTLVETARRVRPDITIVARARDARHARRLYQLGVNDAVPETIEASLQLSEAVLVDIGVPMGPVIASIHQRRDDFRRVLQAETDADTSAGDAPRAAGEFRGRRTAGKRGP